MASSTTPRTEPKASRVRVWQAADRILRSGRRPTVEGVRELLGGGSPNSVTAYLNDWYRELGGRLAAAETPLGGFPAEAVSMMTELWRLAAADQSGARGRGGGDDTAAKVNEAERAALRAEVLALQTLNQELQRHRSSAEKSLTETRALLIRREAALEEERAQAASREQTLAQIRMELEVVLERQRLGSGAPRTAKRRPRSARAAKARPAPPQRKRGAKVVARSKPGRSPASRKKAASRRRKPR
jgi:hypothetical protein